MKKESKNGLFVFLAALLLLFLFFPDVMLHPNSAMFSVEGDGLKNYFSVLYYLQNDHALHFTGMNYPFGEHLSFADGQPALAVPFQYLALVIPQLRNYGFALINISALLSFAIAAWVTYKILLHYKVQMVFAAIGALLLIFFSPQLIRIQAHYGLSYACAFPIAWYCSIKLNEGKHLLKWSILTVAMLVMFGLLHFYLAALNALFLFSFAFFRLVFSFRKTVYKQQLANWLTPALGLVLLQLFMFVTDTISDRPPRPWGFFYAIADWSSILLPHPTDILGNPTRQLDRFGEGFAYLGLIPIVALLFLFIRFAGNMIKLRVQKIKKRLLTESSLYFLSAVPALLFSMCIPFVWGLEELVDLFPFLRQFRVLGRFAWVFYYVAAVYAVQFLYVCFRLYAQHRLKQTGYTFMILAAVIWSTETVARINAINHRIQPVRAKYAEFTDNRFIQLLSSSGHYANEFQAILAFPFFHQGSEQFSIEYGPSQYEGMKAAYQLKIPLVNVVMSRTSLQQSCEVMQLLSDTLIEKKILSRFNTKPLLLVTSGTVFSVQEQQLIAKATLLKREGETSVYQLPLNAFQSNSDTVIQRYNQRNKWLVDHNIYWSSSNNSSAELLYTSKADRPLAAFKTTAPNENTLLFEGPLKNISATDTIEVSTWAKINPLLETLPVLVIERKKSDGTVLQNDVILFKEQTNIYANCVLVKHRFILQNADDIVTVRMAGKGTYARLLIRKTTEDVFEDIPGFGFYVNNIPVAGK
ncbi:MAG: hypothetical protein GXC73_08040 [Chitinophagaceae bacterium]|nr:hypothetical protein [Chitinophagaceae bacterium]